MCDDLGTEFSSDIDTSDTGDFSDGLDTASDASFSDEIEDIPEDDFSDDMVDVSDDLPEDDFEDDMVDVSDDLPEDDFEDDMEDVSDDIPEDEIADDIQDISDDIPEEEFVDDMEDVSDDIPEDEIADDIQDISDDIPEDEVANDIENTSNDISNALYDDFNDFSTSNNENDNIEQSEIKSYDNLSDYMSDHNYGMDDYDTYSQDPVWRDLHRKEFPDSELPPLTQESAKSQLYDYMTEHNYGQDDFNTYSQDPKWRDLQSAAFPDYELPPLNNLDNIGNWSDIPSDYSYQDNLDMANPNYENGTEWQINCQRCVPTYEMRSRGYDVTALPCTDYNDYLSYHPYDVWDNPAILNATGNGLDDIRTSMGDWGDGARAQVCLQWNNEMGGHTFMAEQRNGETCFVDPQTGETDVGWYFDEACPNSVTYCRTDKLMPSSKILNCCKGVKK